MWPDPTGYMGVSSRAGFLGPNEKLLEVLAADNRYVVDKLGLTHQDLARPLHVMGAAGGFERKPQQFLYHGRRYEVEIISWKGTQLSRFYDKTETGCDAVVKNLENGRKLQYSLLVPHMIERYGFYEGKGTSYRVEPEQVLAVFDFLHPAFSGDAGETAANLRIAAWAIGGMFILVATASWWLWRRRASAKPI